MEKITAKERSLKMKYAFGGEDPIDPPIKLYKPKDTQLIKFTDKRKVNPATGKPFKKMGTKGISANQEDITAIIAHAKAQGVDPYTALAIGLQETEFGKLDPNYGSAWSTLPDTGIEGGRNQNANVLAKALKDKLAYAKRLGVDKKGEEFALQTYNGLGILKPKTSIGGKLQDESYYEIPVTGKSPLDLRKNPAYGKVVKQLREEVIRTNPQVNKLIKDTPAYVMPQPPQGGVAGMATGGEVGETPDISGTAGGAGWGAAGQLLPVVGNALMALFDKPGYTNQPIMNAQTARNMTSPYAFGGELDDIDAEQFKMYLEAMFANQASAEEEDETLNEGIDEEAEDEEEESFAMGGKTKKKSKMKGNRRIYANGGMANIEVEDDEIVQTPDGQMQKMKGATHEQGGIDMNVPKGTKIYSDRLELEGKSMQQRKMNREKRLAKAAKMFKASPSDALARNTFERTKEVVGREEEQDMALQKVANKIYSPPQKAAYGSEVGDPWQDNIEAMMGDGYQVPYMPGQQPTPYMSGRRLQNSLTPSTGETLSPINTGSISVTAQTASSPMFRPTASQTSNAEAASTEEESYGSTTGLTTGDYIGLGANLFNAVAPIINSRNAARATKPEINRFKGFGRQALEANAKAQDFASVQMSNAKRELDTAAGSAVLRNRLGARGINTVRALDTVTDINRNKGISDIYGGYTSQMSTLLGQEGQLANQRDQMEMSGATARDEREAQNTDNYYSNMAQNLTNFGTNIGGIGKNLNQAKGNRDNVALLEAMSEYFDFGRDKSGKLILKNKVK